MLPDDLGENGCRSELTSRLPTRSPSKLNSALIERCEFFRSDVDSGANLHPFFFFFKHFTAISAEHRLHFTR